MRTLPDELPDAVFRHLFEAAADGILLVAADGVIRLANPEAAKILGAADGELVGSRVDQFVPLHARPQHARHRADFAMHPRTRPMASGLHLSSQRPDGSQIPVEISLSPVEAGGEHLVMAIIRDVSARRAAERTIAELSETLATRVQHLELLNEELDSFSYSVSHDLRAPLRAIDGFSAALQEDYGSRLPDDARHDLDRIRAGAQRMAALIDDLLALSRISRSDLRIEPVDVSELAESVLAGLREADPDRQVSAEIEPGLQLHADRRLLRVVLENLLGNAWKFTGTRSYAHIRVSGTTLDGQPAVVVSDNGVGFDEQYADKMFGPFQRLHSAEQFPGSGIGLAIVHRILARHGGRIVAGSHPGAGATLVFRTTGVAP